MQRKDQNSSRWRTILGTGLALAGVAIIGATTIAPAKADYDDWRWHREWREHRAREEWRERREEWREDHPRAGIYFSYPAPYVYYEYHYDR
jgi:hypothetical protein